MNIEGLHFFKLEEDSLIKPFNCTDNKLRTFLLEKAKDFQKEYLGVTYILEDNQNTIAYFTICTDSLKVQEEMFASKNAFKRFVAELVTHKKRYLEDFPAIKLGRLAVSEEAKNKKLGQKIIDYLINLAFEINTKVSCKIITVDAYAKSLYFYEKTDFQYLSPKDKDADTRFMYLDLTPYFNALSQT